MAKARDFLSVQHFRGALLVWPVSSVCVFVCHRPLQYYDEMASWIELFLAHRLSSAVF